jgi:ribonuclease P protein component
MSDEAHLPAEQSCARTASRVSVADGDSGRTSGNPRAPGTRSQEAFGLITLTKRSDFVAANAARRFATPGFVLLMRDRQDNDPAIRLGITVTKKIGGAVIRNRMKRRFRALARAIITRDGVSGADHVLIGRMGGLERDYALLSQELTKALAKAKASVADAKR